MKKKVLVLLIGCALALTACGSTGEDAAPVTPAASTEQVSDEKPADETAEDNESGNASSEMTDEVNADGNSTDETDESADSDESWMGEKLTPDADGKVSNGFMTLTMPVETEGTYLAYSQGNSINIYEKEAHEAGFGGFAFGVDATESYEEYGGMRTKIGEITATDGKKYHVLYYGPSDVQFDYEKYSEMPEAYSALYNGGMDIAATLEPADGEYVHGGGTKGAEIFADTAKDVIDRISKAEDANSLEEDDLSPVYFAITQGDEPKDPMTDIGIAYVDCNMDGVEEMVIGDIKTGEVYDIFASVNGTPEHVASGYFRGTYHICNSTVVQHVLESAGVDAWYSYELLPNSTELFDQYALKCDETAEPADKYSVCYDFDSDEWESIDEEDYNIRLENMQYFAELDFKALGDF